MRRPVAALTARWPLSVLLLVAVLAGPAAAARADVLGPVAAFLGGQRSTTGAAVLVHDSFTGAPLTSVGAWQPSDGPWTTTGGAAAPPGGVVPDDRLTVPAGTADVEVFAHLASPQALGMSLSGVGVPFTVRYGVVAASGTGGYLSAGVICGLAACTTNLWWASGSGVVTLLQTGVAVSATSGTAVRLRVSGGQACAWFGTTPGTPLCAAVPGAITAQRGAGLGLTSTISLGTTPRAFLDVTAVPAATVA